MAIIESFGSRRWVQSINEPARTEGVCPGQTVATALALCPDLLLREHDPAAENEALEEAALAALRFTPSVSLVAGGLRLEVAASLRLFGGFDALLEQLCLTQSDLGLCATVGIAETAHGAGLLARTPKRSASERDARRCLVTALASVPVTLLESAQVHRTVLEGIGCYTLGQLRELPRDGVARRFGAALLDEVDSAYGLMPDPHLWFVAPEQFVGHIELLARSESLEALMVVVQRLMTQLAGWLEARHAATQDLVLTLGHEHWRRDRTAPTVLRIGLASPSRDPKHLHGLVCERLGRITLDAPVETVSLAAYDLCSSAALNQELFPTQQSTALTLLKLTEKLAARFGGAAIRRVLPHSDHRPEKAWRTRARATTPGHATTRATRPAWLMKEPEVLATDGSRPIYGTPLAFLTGPERIEAGWWDDALVTRDYYVAENAIGQRLWVYRERDAQGQRPAWFLHGVFA